MTLARNLTAANQLTILRMLIIPAFVILLLYGHNGWALVAFFVAGLTDLFDGLIARLAGQKTTLGAWLDPMADKLLLVTMFVMLTLPVAPAHHRFNFGYQWIGCGGSTGGGASGIRTVGNSFVE